MNNGCNGQDPIYTITPRMVNLLVAISTRLGEINVIHKERINPKLRKENRIRTIHSSLAIENNTLTLEQVTAILDGKRVLGSPVEIKEVQNANNAYELMLGLDALNIEHLLEAHRQMMDGLVKEAGRFRGGAVGIFNGDEVVHVAPPAWIVPELVRRLFDWYQQCELHPFIKSAIFHYEFEFIHPFADGNGRIGRMWHTMLLGECDEVFYWLPIEELIKERQQEYYAALGCADKNGDCSVFVETMLEIIARALKELV